MIKSSDGRKQSLTKGDYMLSPSDIKKIDRLEKRIIDLEKDRDIDRKIINKLMNKFEETMKKAMDEVTHAYYIESEFRNDDLKLMRGLENELRAKK